MKAARPGEANLREANPRWCVLDDADLEEANFRDAKVRRFQTTPSPLREKKLPASGLCCGKHGSKAKLNRTTGVQLSVRTRTPEKQQPGKRPVGAATQSENRRNRNRAVFSPETVLPSGKNAAKTWAIQQGALFREP